MTNAVFVALINSGVAILVSGIYVAMAIRILRSRRWLTAILPTLTALAYAYPSTRYVWAAIQGRAPSDINPYGLLLVVLPALVIFQILRSSKQEEVEVNAIIEELGK